MATQLTPLKPNQPTLTFVPKITTDLPFFNLTYNKHNTPTEIKFEGKDEAGNSIRWEVYHNTSEEIGYAGVLAHKVWYLLIKPAIDSSKLPDGSIPQIIQLGGIRECLRLIGWTAGGHEAKELIKVLSQIAFAGCVADLWFPTGETDEEGKEKYLQVKGRFSRLSVYAIGEHHLTQEELEKAQFNFDLEDSLYIELNSLEIKLHQIQAEQQRLIDNEYMFSVKPIARRWYELLAGKVFGTLKYQAPFFEIRYSWYLKYHHNLKRYYERFRVVQQMDRVVADHLEFGFLTKTEYRKSKNADGKIDFVIRYYVGSAAQNSISKIKGYLLNNERRKQEISPNIKKANKTPESIQENKEHANIPFSEENGSGAANLPIESISDAESGLNKTDLETIERREVIKRLILEYKISTEKAQELATKKLAECQKQLAAFPFREVETINAAGFLIKAIELSYSLPDAYTEYSESKKFDETQHLEKEIIDNCSFCDDTGHRLIKSETDTEFGELYRCSHNPDVEKLTEDHKFEEDF
ncbi:MAG: hypothetical protein ACR2MD_13430 [Aridibacter sp.]